MTWSEQQSDEPTQARARFIRLQMGLARLGDEAAPFIKYSLADQEATLLQDHKTAWAGALATLVEDYAFDRGFVALVRISAAQFLDRAAELFALAPIEHLDLTTVHGVQQELFASTYLSRIYSLSLDGAGLDDTAIRLLASSPNLESLCWLSLTNNSIGMEGAEAIA